MNRPRPADQADRADTPRTLLVTGESSYIVSTDDADERGSFSDIDLDDNTIGPGGELWATTSTPESGYPGDSEGLVYAQTFCPGGEGARRQTRLVRHDNDTLTRTVIAEGLPPLDGIALEPDGDVVGVEQAQEGCNVRVGTRQGLVRVDPRGKVTPLATDLQFPTDVAVAPDGSYLVTSSGWTDPGSGTEDMDGGALLRVPAAGGEPSVVARVSFPQGLDLSPDGTVWTAGSTEGGSSSGRSGVVEEVAPDGVTRRLEVDRTLADVTTFAEAPVVSAVVSSKRGRNAAGWYSTSVTVRFTCAEGSAPLANDCPAPVSLRNADGTLERTITSSDGSSASGSVTVRVTVDTTKPTLRTRLAGDAPYAASARPVRCSATDALSGVAGDCSVSYGAVRTRANGSRFRTWTASVRDVAGNRTTRTGSFGVRR